MNRILLILGLFLITATRLFSQVGIGTTDPKDSAQLDVVAADKGILIPRVSLVKTTQYTPITGVKVNSLLVYNTQTKTTTAGEEVYPGYYYWYEGKWNRVISKQDFNSKEIIKNILNGSNIVTYDPVTKNFNYYTATGPNTVNVFDVINNTTSGTINSDKIKAGKDWEVLTSKSGTTVWEDILTIINNSSSTQQIDPAKIKPGDKINDVLTTVTKTVNGSVVTVTDWKNIKDLVNVDGKDIHGADGIKFSDGTSTSNKVSGAVLKTFTVTVSDLPVSKLEKGTKGTTLVTDSSGNVTWTTSLPASTTISVTNIVGTTTGVVVMDKSGHATVTAVNNMLSGTNVVIYDTKSETFNYYTNSGTGTTTNVNIVNVINNTATSSTISSTRITAGKDWEVLTSKSNTTVWEDIIKVLNNNTSTTKIDAGKINGKDLTTPANSGVSIVNGAGAVLKTTTITIENLPVAKLKAGNNGQYLTVTSGIVTWTTPSTGVTKELLTLGDGLYFGTTGSDTTKSVVVEAATIRVQDLPVDKLKKGDKGTILVTDMSGNVTWTNQLPASTTISVTNIVGTTTGVVVIDKPGHATVTTIERLISNTLSATNGLTKSGTVIELGGALTKSTTIVTTESNTLILEGLTNTSTVQDTDKVVVQGDDNVLRTVSATAFRGSGNYVIKNSYPDNKDELTGNFLIDETGGGATLKFVEKMRTVEVYVAKTSTTSITTELLALDENKLNNGEIMISEVKIFSKGKVFTDSSLDTNKKRFVSFSAATYEVIDDTSGGSSVKKGVVRPGVSSGGFTTSIYRGWYYISIKYLEKQP